MRLIFKEPRIQKLLSQFHRKFIGVFRGLPTNMNLDQCFILDCKKILNRSDFSLSGKFVCGNDNNIFFSAYDLD